MMPRRRLPPPKGLIDRDPQNLLLPVAGFAPVRRRVRRRRLLRSLRRRPADIVNVVALLLAAIGTAVTLSQVPVPVYVESDVIHVGSLLLHHPVDNGGLAPGVSLYTGWATLVLAPGAAGSARASAVTFLRGQRVEGVCVMPAPTPSRLTERCSFSIGGRRLLAEDRLDFNDPGQWYRHYSDGRDVLMGVPAAGGVIPVPFPIGE